MLALLPWQLELQARNLGKDSHCVDSLTLLLASGEQQLPHLMRSDLLRKPSIGRITFCGDSLVFRASITGRLFLRQRHRQVLHTPPCHDACFADDVKDAAQLLVVYEIEYGFWDRPVYRRIAIKRLHCCRHNCLCALNPFYWQRNSLYDSLDGGLPLWFSSQTIGCVIVDGTFSTTCA